MFRFGLFARIYEENKEGQEGQEGKGTPPPFDPDSFFAKIAGEFNKGINALDKRLKAIEKTPPAEPPKKADPVDPPKGEEQPKGERQPQPNSSPEYNALATRLQEVQTDSANKIRDLEQKTLQAEAKAERKDRESQITSALASYRFRSETARADAVRYFTDVAQRDDEENLIANDLPLKKFIEQEMGPAGSRSYMIAPVETNGSGAGKGSGHGAGKPVDINDIKPGMSKEELARTRAQIAALTSQAQ